MALIKKLVGYVTYITRLAALYCEKLMCYLFPRAVSTVDVNRAFNGPTIPTSVVHPPTPVIAELPIATPKSDSIVLFDARTSPEVCHPPPLPVLPEVRVNAVASGSGTVHTPPPFEAPLVTDDNQDPNIPDIEAIDAQIKIHLTLAKPSTVQDSEEIFRSTERRRLRFSRPRRVCRLPVVVRPTCHLCRRDAVKEWFHEGSLVLSACAEHASGSRRRQLKREFGRCVERDALWHEHDLSCQVIQSYDVDIRHSVVFIRTKHGVGYANCRKSKPVKEGIHAHKCRNCDRVYNHSHDFGEPGGEVHVEYPGDCPFCSRPVI